MRTGYPAESGDSPIAKEACLHRYKEVDGMEIGLLCALLKVYPIKFTIKNRHEISDFGFINALGGGERC